MKSNVDAFDNEKEGGYYYEGDEDHSSLHHNEDGDRNNNHVELGTNQLINPDNRDIASDDGDPTVEEIKVCVSAYWIELTFVWHLINAVLQGLLEDPQYPVSENGGDYSDPGIPFDLRDYEAKSADTYIHIGGTTLHLGKINVGDKR